MMLSLPVNHYLSETHPICEILLTLPLLVVSLVIMTVSSIIDHGSVEATNFIPFIGIVPITARLIKEGKNDK